MSNIESIDSIMFDECIDGHNKWSTVGSVGTESHWKPKPDSNGQQKQSISHSIN